MPQSAAGVRCRYGNVLGSAQVTSAISSQFVENGGIGTNTISLRGLGANRTLLLLNGRRAGPSGTRGGVSSFDLGVLPIATIERIEVLKDGASSIYGSDAVAGVVNIITRREDGGTLDGFVSAPSSSGGEQTRLSASWGRDYNRGGFRITGDYNKQEELAQGDRDYFNCEEDYVFDPDSGDGVRIAPGFILYPQATTEFTYDTNIFNRHHLNIFRCNCLFGRC